MFLAAVHEVARTVFRQAIRRVGIEPFEPGNSYPQSYRRYHVMGVVEGYDREVEVDLGFWMGPTTSHWYMELACADVTRAIVQRWAVGGAHVRAGFAWDEAKM